MSDELEPKDELEVAEDEELMSDYKDIFSDDDAASGDAEDDTLDELDAFLDDFEKNLDIPDAEETPAAETVAEESPRGSAEDIGLDKSDLDLDVGLDGETNVDEPLLDEAGLEDDEPLDLDAMMEEPGSAQTQEEVAGEPEPEAEAPAAVEPKEPESPLPEAVAAAAAASVATAPTSTAPITPQPAAAGLSKGQLYGGAALLLFSGLLSLAALWMVMGLGTQIDILNQNVSELQQRVLAQSRRGSISPQVQWGDQLNRLAARVNELAVIVEGPVGHLRESNQQALQEMGSRLDELEKSLAGKGAAVPAKKLVSKPEPVMAKAVPSKTRSTKQGWVINLLSVASAKTADDELARLRKMGVRADKQTVSKEGKTWYRLRVTGFDSYEGAKAYIETIEQQTGFKAAWVAKE